MLVGLSAELAFRYSERSRRAPEPVPPPAPSLDEGALRILAALRSAVVVLDENDRLVRVSPAAHAVGLVRDGRLAHAAVREMVHQVRVGGDVADGELELPRGPFGHSTMVLHLRVAPLGARDVLVLADDRTETRRLEAVRRDFTANISHELKTPIGALALLAETVQDAADDPEAVRRFAAQMQTEAARLARLVTEIIELSRLQLAGALGEPVPVQMGEVVREAVDRTRVHAADRSVRIEVNAPRSPVVYGDHDLLVTAVRNLVDNAVAYSEAGGVVAIDLRQRGDVVEVVVVDQGIGIAEADQERVFERFFRVDPARSRDTGGTGLGLSIVKHTVAEHGGEVTLWSQPGQGSTFTLRLPAAPATEEGE